MPDTTTFKLRKMLICGHLQVSLEELDANLEFRSIVEEDDGFEAEWAVTPIGERYLEVLQSIGVVVGILIC